MGEQDNLLDFVQFLVALQDFPSLDAALGDVLVLAEHQVVVWLHGTTEVVRLVVQLHLIALRGDAFPGEYIAEVRIELPVGLLREKAEQILPFEQFLVQEPKSFVLDLDIDTVARFVQQNQGACGHFQQSLGIAFII